MKKTILLLTFIIMAILGFSQIHSQDCYDGNCTNKYDATMQMEAWSFDDKITVRTFLSPTISRDSKYTVNKKLKVEGEIWYYTTQDDYDNRECKIVVTFQKDLVIEILNTKQSYIYKGTGLRNNL